MGKNFNEFDRSIKDAFENYNAPYSESSWKDMENRLRTQGAAESGGTLTSFIAAAILLALMGSMFFMTLWSPVSKGAERLTEDKGFEAKTRLSIQNIDSASVEELDLNDDSALTAISNLSNTAQSSKSSKSKSQKDIASKTQTLDVQTAEDTQLNEKDANANTPAKVGSELIFGCNVREACAGVSVIFQLESGNTQAKFLWNFGDGNFSSQPNPVHVYSKPGAYDVTLSVTSSADGQIKTRTVKDMVLINPRPHANFDWEFENSPAEAPRVKLINKSESASAAVWSIKEKSFSQDINPSLSLNKEGDYPIKLLVVNEFGCVDSVYQYVTIGEDFNLLAPDAFSPNGDGLNDYFMPEALRIRDLNFKLTIYNNNQAIFESTDRYNPWKGILPNGTLANAGTSYPWVVQLTNEKGDEEYYSGTVTVTP